MRNYETPIKSQRVERSAQSSKFEFWGLGFFNMSMRRSASDFETADTMVQRLGFGL